MEPLSERESEPTSEPEWEPEWEPVSGPEWGRWPLPGVPGRTGAELEVTDVISLLTLTYSLANLSVLLAAGAVSVTSVLVVTARSCPYLGRITVSTAIYQSNLITLRSEDRPVDLIMLR